MHESEQAAKKLFEMSDEEVYPTKMQYDDKMLRHPNLNGDPVFTALKAKIAGFLREQDRAKHDPYYQIEKEGMKKVLFSSLKFLLIEVCKTKEDNN